MNINYTDSINSEIVLSICVPTYNRLNLLKDCLAVLAKEVEQYSNKVEIVISDNGSSDGTDLFLDSLSKLPYVKAFKKRANTGVSNNIDDLVRRRAQGEYVWVIGDDDIVFPGSIKFLLELFDKFPSNYYFLNHTYLPLGQRLFAINGQVDRDLRMVCNNTSCGYVEHFEDIVNFSAVSSVFTSIVSHLAKRELWTKLSPTYDRPLDFDNFSSTFPHLSLLLPSVVGERVFYVGQPLVHLCIGSQEWFSEKWIDILSTHIVAIPKMMNALGAPKQICNKYLSFVYDELSAYYKNLP